MINGKQCTIVFYIDDNKISHVYKDVVTDILNQISARFGDLTVSRGNIHDFLGMKIEVKDKVVNISMKDQVKEAIEWGGTQSGRKPVTPASSNLFEKSEPPKFLLPDESDSFHSVVQKLLYIYKRARPDIEPALSFLCTRVSKPTSDDREKLNRVLDYLSDTIDDVRTIGADGLDTLYKWVEASYAVHRNMRSQSKQKLNIKSSTEAELLAVSDYLPYHISMIIFFEIPRI